MRNPDGRFLKDKVWIASFFLSAILHATFFFFWWGEEVPFTADLVHQGATSVALSPSSVMQVVRIQSATQNAVVRPVVPRVVFEGPPVLEIEVAASIEVSSLLLNDIGEIKGRPLVSAPDLEGQDLGIGSAFTTPPLPRGIVIPQFNKELDVEEIEVGVFVDKEGRVVADSTRIVSPVNSISFSSQLIEQAAEWIFDPATKAGKAISGWFFYTIKM
jgi:hypothetical protein